MKEKEEQEEDSEESEFVLHKETSVTDGARPIDHHLQLTEKPLQINMYDEMVGTIGESSASAGT